MRRRRLLRSAGALAMAAAAGCASGGPGDGSDGEPTPTPGEPEPSFAVTSANCGTQTKEAAVTFDDGQVTVEGTIWGNDACYTGHLESATLDGGTLTLRVVAVSTAETGESCAQCITEIEYRATVETAIPPDEVVVVHDGETVATVSITYLSDR